METNGKLGFEMWANDTGSLQMDGRDMVNVVAVLGEDGDTVAAERELTRVAAFLGLVLSFDDGALARDLWAQAVEIEAREDAELHGS